MTPEAMLQGAAIKQPLSLLHLIPLRKLCKHVALWLHLLQALLLQALGCKHVALWLHLGRHSGDLHWLCLGESRPSIGQALQLLDHLNLSSNPFPVSRLHAHLTHKIYTHMCNLHFPGGRLYAPMSLLLPCQEHPAVALKSALPLPPAAPFLATSRASGPHTAAAAYNMGAW